MSFNYDTWKRYVAKNAKYGMKYAAGAGGVLAGGLIGNVPGAIVGGKMAYDSAKRKYEPENSYPTPEKTPKKRKMASYGLKGKKMTKKYTVRARSKGGPKYKQRKVKKTIKKMFKRARSGKPTLGLMVGGIGGKFNKPSYRGMKKQKPLSTVLRLGYNVIKEDHGTVLDSDSVYIQHSNYRPNEIARCIVGALYRKLFRKAGIEVDNLENELPLYDNGNSDGFKIQFTRKNPLDATYTTSDITITDNQSFDMVVNSFNGTEMFSSLVAYMKQTTNDEPYKLALYASDRNGVSTNWRLASELNLENEKVHISLSSRVTIQNRTKGSAAESNQNEIERVDNQPIKGFIYEFKNADPRLKSTVLAGTQGGGTFIYNRDFLYNSGDVNRGIRTYGGNQITGPLSAKYMREPPPAKLWKNIAGVSSVSLDPGIMKSVSIKSYYENYLLTLLKKFRVSQVLNPGSQNMDEIYRNVQAGKCQIVCLEEVLRTPADNQIVCVYENEFRCGVYCVTKKKKGVLLSEFSTGQAAIPQYAP